MWTVLRPAWNAARIAKNMGKPFYTVEDILRSRTTNADGTTSGRLSFRDIVFANGLAGESMLFHWQVLARTPTSTIQCEDFEK